MTVRAAPVLGMALAACAEAPFSPHRPDNLASDLDPVVAKVRGGSPEGRSGGTPAAARPDNATGAPIVAAVSPGPDATLSVHDLVAQKALFSVKADVRSRVLIAGGLLIAREGDRQIVGRDLRTGEVRWQRDLEGGATFMGAATDGDGVYYVTEEATREKGRDVSTIVGLDADSGSRRFRLGAASRLGAPAARGGLVFVPFGYQWIVALDGGSGDELARLRNKEEAINFVLSAPEGVFYGSRSVFRLDRRSVSGTRAGSTHFAATLPEDFLRVLYHFDGYNAAQSGYTAYDRNRLLWIPRADGTGFHGDVVLTSYRFFFGMESGSGKLRWAYSFPRVDVVASAHTGSHVVLVSSEGDVVALDAGTGGEAMRAKLPGKVAGATIDARGFAPKAGGAPAVELRDALLGIIWDPDRRFEAVKLFALAEMGRIVGTHATEDLIKVLTFERIDRKVYEKAGEALLGRIRAEDVGLLVRALATRTDYVEGTKARGVDMLARAAGKLKGVEAVEPLLSHFGDPETPPAALREIVKALDQIGSQAVLGPFREFLLTYRADADLANEPDVLRRVCDALLRLGIQHDRQLVRFVAEDPQTQAYLRKYASGALKGKKPPEKQGDKKDEKEVKKEKEPNKG